jgi:hypothetical protein
MSQNAGSVTSQEKALTESSSPQNAMREMRLTFVSLSP